LEKKNLAATVSDSLGEGAEYVFVGAEVQALPLEGGVAALLSVDHVRPSDLSDSLAVCILVHAGLLRLVQFDYEQPVQKEYIALAAFAGAL